MKKIKIILSLFVVAMMVAFSTPMMAQSEAELKSMAEEEAQTLIDDGYKPSGLPIKLQLLNYYKKMMETTASGEQKYLEGHGIATASSQAAAQATALKTARESLVQSIRSAVVTRGESEIGNTQFSTEDAATIDNFFQKGGSLSAEELTDYITAKNIFKRLPNGNIEVQVTILYDRKKLQNKVHQKAVQNLRNGLNNMN